jgi:peptidoglycan/xylan/chitin deacetylase (PgdA/CDA1 family)
MNCRLQIADCRLKDSAPARLSDNLQSAICNLQSALGCLPRRAVEQLAAGLSRFVGRCPGDGFGILTYHRVAEPVGQPTWNVSPGTFRAQLSGVLARGYEPWPLRRLLAHAAAGQRIPRRAFAVTFDDGYENTFTHAWPILRELGVPATVFLATAYLDSASPFPFDDWQAAGSAAVAAEAWRPLRTEQCRALLEDQRIELGSHTHSHVNFRGRPADFAADLASSLRVLRDQLGLADPVFSFPFGVFEADLIEAARRGGVACALTTQASLVRPGSDPFAWGRFGVEERDTPGTLAARLDGWYALARQVWLRALKPVLGGARAKGR